MGYTIKPCDNNIFIVHKFDETIINTMVIDNYTVDKLRMMPDLLNGSVERMIYADEFVCCLYGDNAARYGEKGQSIIRKGENTFGILTKRKPNRDNAAYLSDDDFDLTKSMITRDIIKVMEVLDGGVYDYACIPRDGIGTGLAEMKKRCPKTFNHLCSELYKYFGFKNPGWEECPEIVAVKPPWNSPEGLHAFVKPNNK